MDLRMDSWPRNNRQAVSRALFAGAAWLDPSAPQSGQALA
jgi:hypothetical protein